MNTIFLETDRLIIKIASHDDYEKLCVLQSDPDAMYYIGNGVRTPIEVQNLLNKAIHHHKKHGFSMGTIYERNTDLFIGWGGIFYPAFDDTQPDIGIGYMFHKEYWHKGYGTELAKAIIKWGFEHLSVDKLVAFVNPNNQGSRRVLEKAGMCYIDESEYRNKKVAKFEINRES